MPPFLITSVILLNISIKDIGPDAVPFVLEIKSPFGLMRLKLNPVPPPLFCIRDIIFIELNMLSSESSIGSTKHAANCPTSVPAFINVGELGKNSKLDIIL